MHEKDLTKQEHSMRLASILLKVETVGGTPAHPPQPNQKSRSMSQNPDKVKEEAFGLVVEPYP